MVCIFWTGPGWYASVVRQDSGAEVILPLECGNNNLEAYQKGLGTPFWLDAPPAGAVVK